MLPHRLGPVSQIAYVVKDLQAAARFWSQSLSVGPFFRIDHCRFEQLEVDGRPSDADFSLALAWSGGVQIELVEQHDQTPSVFNRFAPAVAGGFHHIGIATNDLAVDEQRLVAAGMRCVQTGLSARGTRTAFYHGGQPEMIIELIQSADGGKLWAELQQAAAHWDGTQIFIDRLGSS